MKSYGGFFLRYTNDELSKLSNQRLQYIKFNREDKLALHHYFKGKATQKGDKKE